MSEPASQQQDSTVSSARNEAWAAVNTPLEADQLVAFCSDIERLIRINPMLEFKRFDKTGEHQYRLQGRNISQVPAFEFDEEIEVEPLADGCRIQYSTGLKTSTRIKISAAEQPGELVRSTLHVTDYYAGHDEKALQKRLNEVDKSLIPWLKDVQKYLLQWRKWSKFRLYRWYMRRVWLPMKPSGRRITYMLLWISLVEVALIALGAAIYIVEYT